MRLVDCGELQIAWPSSSPELITKRLRLRAPLPRDASAVLAVIGDPEVTRYHSVPTFTTLVEAQAALKRLEQRYAARDAIRWAIELVEHGEMIGTVGLLRFDFEHRHAEIGCEIARRWWGRGLTPEAASIESRLGCCLETTPRCGYSRSSDSVKRGRDETSCNSKGRFHSFRWFALLETDESDHPATI